MMIEEQTIVAAATLRGRSAIGIVRLSGDKAIEIADMVFFSKKGKLKDQRANSTLFGLLRNDKTLIDECLFSVFKAPASYTGENMVEISHHGSPYIQQQIILLLISLGARAATEGEFTKRAFLNGKINLSQAEAVADVINANSKMAHHLALKQLRGGYEEQLQNLRKQLLDIASLLELELDFSEEDIDTTFANRDNLRASVASIKKEIEVLLNTFAIGNAFKQGIAVSIVGKPNSGKSTLLNTLLNDNRSIVSDIAGTTRDTIEEQMTINGIDFRFIDTAGIRSDSDNTIETEGISRTYKAVEKSKIVLYLIDLSSAKIDNIEQEINELGRNVDLSDKELILIGNKVDISDFRVEQTDIINISAAKKINIEQVIKKIADSVAFEGMDNKILITNARHYEAMQRALEATIATQEALEQKLPSDLIATNVRCILHYIGEITGEVTTQEILGNIFSKFCIGK